MLRTAKTDALGTKLEGSLGVGRRVSICAHAEFAILVGPLHHTFKVTRELRCLGSHFANHHLARRAIDRDGIFVRERATFDLKLATLFVDFDFAGTSNTAAAPTPSDDRRVAGHTAGTGQNARG